jgi:membrane fusion protein, copper/silver efflux system
MNKAMKYMGLFFLLAIAGFGCQKKEGKEAHSEHAQKMYTCPMHPQIMEPKPGSCPICGMDLVPVSQNESEEGIMLSNNQIRLANIETQVLTSGSIGNNTLLTARIVANENLTAQISSRIGGRIEKMYVKQVGEVVKKGDPLYELYSEALLTLQQEYLLALAQQKALGDKDENYKRILQGAKEKLLLYGMNENQIREITNQEKVKSTVTFFSKGAGTVSEISVTEGQYVAEGSPIMSLTDLSSLWVEAQLYPTEVPQVKMGSTVDIRVSGYGSEVVKGKVIFLAPELEANSKIILLRAQIDNREMKYRPGMQASLTLTSDSKNALTLPLNAVIRDEQGSYVWKQTGEGTFSPVMVNLGSENATSVQITSGLSEGDTVVVSGAYLLHSEYILKKGGNPMAGHDHSGMNM